MLTINSKDRDSSSNSSSDLILKKIYLENVRGFTLRPKIPGTKVFSKD